MKKSTLVVLITIYIASIVVISVFGLNAVFWNEVIPVKSIECINKTDENSEVTLTGEGKKFIKIKYGEPGIVKDGVPEGTMLQLEWRVLPDNATNKEVRFVYNTELTRVNFVKNKDGKELGLILFTGKVKLDLQIVSTDGTRVVEDVVIWVY